MWLLASIWFRGEVRGLGNIPDSGPVLLVGNHSGGNMTPGHDRLHARVQHLLRRRARLLPARPQPRAVDAGARRSCASSARSRPRPRTPRKALRLGRGAARLPGRRLRGPPAELAQRNRVDFGGRKGFIRLALEQNVPIVPVVSIGGQETALFLTPRRAARAPVRARPAVPPEGAARSRSRFPGG